MTNASVLVSAYLVMAGLSGCAPAETIAGTSESEIGLTDWSISDDSLPANDRRCEGNSIELHDTACPSSATSLRTDACDEAFADADWTVVESGHFVFHTIAGSAAHADLARIAAVREAAYDDIRAALEISEQPQLELYMSPNRVAAKAHGLSTGRAFPAAGRYEVVYTGAPDGYESVRYGHELTHVLAYHLDPGHVIHLGVLSEGLAEYLDQSGRDLHAAYASNLATAVETRTRVTEFEQRDVWGNNYGRAGSLVQFLGERYGMPAVVEMFQRSHLVWMDGCYRNPDAGCVNGPADIAPFLSVVLEAVTGEAWSDVEPVWGEIVHAALMSDRPSLSEADREQIVGLFRHMDSAIATNDAAAYRATMEGFYCDWGGEDIRSEIAARVVNAFDQTESIVVDAQSVGVKNFPAARAIVLRRDRAGNIQTPTFDLEKLPAVGWRITWGPDWN